MFVCSDVQIGGRSDLSHPVGVRLTDSHVSVSTYTLHGYTGGVEARSAMKEEILYRVPGIHCGHCEAAIREELSTVSGVEEVAVDLETKEVRVEGTGLKDEALRAAIDEAGYEAA